MGTHSAKEIMHSDHLPDPTAPLPEYVCYSRRRFSAYFAPTDWRLILPYYFRNPVDRVAFPESSVLELSMNKTEPLFVQGIRLRRGYMPQKPCKQGAILKICVPKAILEQKSTVICSRKTVRQKPCASEALWRGCHFKNRNTGTKYRHFVFHEFFNRAGRHL